MRDIIRFLHRKIQERKIWFRITQRVYFPFDVPIWKFISFHESALVLMEIHFDFATKCYLMYD